MAARGHCNSKVHTGKECKPLIGNSTEERNAATIQTKQQVYKKGSDYTNAQRLTKSATTKRNTTAKELEGYDEFPMLSGTTKGLQDICSERIQLPRLNAKIRNPYNYKTKVQPPSKH
jgi:hypothetical protein